MSRLAIARLLGMLLLACVFLVPSARGESKLPESLAPALKAARGALAAAKLNEAQAKAAKTHLDSAETLEAESETLRQRWHELQHKAEPGVTPPPVVLGREELEAELRRWSARLPPEKEVAALERLLAQEQAETAELNRRSEATADALTQLIARPGQRFDEQAALRRRAEAGSTPLPAETGEPPALFEARRLRREAEQRRALVELAVGEMAQITSPARQRALEIELQQLRQEVSRHAPRVDILENRIAQGRSLRLDATVQEQEMQLAAATNSAELEAARENLRLAKLLQESADGLRRERSALNGYQHQRESITGQLRDTQARLRLGGDGDAIGHWLWRQRLDMPSLDAIARDNRRLQARLSELRLQLYNATEQRYALKQPAADATGALPTAMQASREAIIDQLEPVLRRRIDLVEQSLETLGGALAQGEELYAVMNRQLLWVPSHRAIAHGWLSAPPEAAARAESLARLIGDAFTGLHWRPVDLAAPGLLIVLAALAYRARIHLIRIASRTRDLAQDRFQLTGVALLWTLLLAAPWPAAAWLLAKALQRQAPPADILGGALLAACGLLAFFSCVCAFCVRDGLAEAHLGWPSARTQRLFRASLAAAALTLPAIFVISLALRSEVARAVDVHARLAIMAYAAGMAAVAWQAAGPARLGLRLPAPALLLGAVAMTALGYVYTVATLLGALLNSIAVWFAVVLIDGLLRRWLLLGERQLALARIQERELTSHDHESGKTAPDASDEIALVKVSTQSRRLLRALRFILLGGGLLLAWSEVLPALLRFESTVLWRAAGSEGLPGEPVTLMDALAAVVTVVLSASMARNLPGLLELLLASRSRISAATRYTAATLLRYGIVIVGTLAACALIGLRWSQLQWMAAALTVGLGFGLQEIFANFVSGLILLVERPFRVGDTVTINNLTGVVTRIRTRATTLQDYDHKEIVIPNKTFITGQVVNWTLSDTVTRLVVAVGAAYGSPVETVRELLLRAAREHPEVLAEPPPRSWFMALGDNALQFELRVFVGNPGDRLKVQNDINARIVALFDEAGIAIPFPQMDVHFATPPADDQSPHPSSRCPANPPAA